MDAYEEWAARARVAGWPSAEETARLLDQVAGENAEQQRTAETALLERYAAWILRCIRMHGGTARRWLQHGSPERSEMLSAALVGFLNAIRRLAPPAERTHDVGVDAVRRRLCAYSEARIRKELRAVLAEHDHGLHPDVAAVRHRVRQMAAVLTQTLGRPATPAEVAARLAERAGQAIRARRGADWKPLPWELWKAGAVSANTVAQYLATRHRSVVSIEDTVDTASDRSGATLRLADVLPDRSERADEQLMRQERETLAVHLVAAPDPRVASPHLRRLMLQMQYGVGGKYPYSLTEIASLVGLTPHHVRVLNADTVDRAAQMRTKHASTRHVPRS